MRTKSAKQKYTATAMTVGTRPAQIAPRVESEHVTSIKNEDIKDAKSKCMRMSSDSQESKGQLHQE